MEYSRDKLKSVLAILGVVIVVLGIILGVAYSYSSREVVGTVAGTKIHRNEFIFVLKSVRRTLEESTLSQQATKEEKETFWNSVIEGKTARETAEDIALDESKKLKIQLIKAKENNIVLTTNEVYDNNNGIEEMVRALGGRAKAADKMFEVYGVSINDYRRIIGNMSLIRKYVTYEKSKLEASEEEVLDYYNKNYENEEEATVRHILLSTLDKDQKPLSDDKIEEKRLQAQEILDKIKNGEDFETLVRENTYDMSSKGTLGQYTVKKGQKVAEFEKWAFNSKPGDMGIIKSEYGFHVMVKPTFEDLKEEIQDKVKEDKYNDLLDEWSKLPEYDLEINQKALQSVRNIIEG